MNKLLNILIPLIDHLYIFQLLEYQSGDFWRWFSRYPLKRNLQRKQHIVWTRKAQILLMFSFILVVLSSLIISGVKPLLFFTISLLLTQISPIFILASNLLFKPLEAYQKNKIFAAARSKRKKFQDLQVIAIVGSYAKTSTKNMLYTLLWKDFKVVKTPKSYNTELSIARSILSDLKENTEIYICEMDAYHQGEISRLCSIAQPTSGIITAIGPQHLERFGSLKTLAKTQFELGEYLANRKAIKSSLREGKSDEAISQELRSPHPKGTTHFVVACYARDDAMLFLNHKDEWSVKLADDLNQPITFFNNSTHFISNRKEGEHGQTFTIHLGKEKTEISLPLKGEHNAINFLASAVIAYSFGLPIKTIKERAKLILPTDHRLEIRQMGNITILDNTYNANPKAALASLELLGSYKDVQKIIITPGFVELGKDHTHQHQEFAKVAGEVVDEFIVVGENAKKPIIQGLKDAGFSAEHIHSVETTAKALAHLSTITQGKSVVLLENDLPDQYF
jgi:UDP-N-acetylmuramoyl-tripeptide--D-alanyl-D-alanine ligase